MAALAVMAVAPPSAADTPKAHRLHLDRIDDLSRISRPTAGESLRLGLHHQQMGEFYAIMATTLGDLVALAAACYGDTVKWGEGAEYFGALGSLESGRPDRALDFCEQAQAAKNIPPILRDLSRSLEGVARAEERGETYRSPGNSSTGWRTVEQCTHTDGDSGCSHCDGAAPGETLVDDVSFKPLHDRYRLRQLICDGASAPLRDYLTRLDDRLEFWEVRFPGVHTTEYSDPALIRAMSQAHLMLAQDAIGAAMTGSLTRQEAFWGQQYLARANLRLGAWQDFDMTDYPDSSVLLPYRGWVAIARGDTQAGWQAWNRCRRSDHYRARTELLSMWSILDPSKLQGDSLAAALIIDLGDSDNLQRLRSSKVGRDRLYFVYASVGQWYLAKAMHSFADGRAIYADSATLLYEDAAVGFDLSLATYQPVFCAAYLAARAASGRYDFLRECYNRWEYLSRFFPASRYMENPLSVVLLCQRPR